MRLSGPFCASLAAFAALCACNQLVSPVLVAGETMAPSEHGSELFGGNGGGGSLLGALLSPLRETLRHAKRLLGSRADQVENFVQDNFDHIQAQAFKMFMQMYNKTYSPAEIPKRMALFFERRKVIEDSVRAFSEGRLPFMMRENAYIDWDERELKALTGVSPPKSLNELTDEEREMILSKGQGPAIAQQPGEAEQQQQRQQQQQSGTKANEADGTITLELADAPASGFSWLGVPTVSRAAPSVAAAAADEQMNLTVRAPVTIPATKDWRKSGCVAAPVNQEKCGCCYAIATMNTLESMRCINQVSSPVLSAQQVIDCSTPRAGYQNYGCDGGWPTRVLKYLQDVGTAARETCYPFVKRQQYCKLSRVRNVRGCTVSSSISNSRLRYKVLNNERDILYHVAKTGPVITVMRATDRFLYYGSGIFDDSTCSRRADDVDHAITIVGYGRENGQDYWLIKNSWGADWGQDGYGKYKRGTHACSIGHWGWVLLE